MPYVRRLQEAAELSGYDEFSLYIEEVVRNYGVEEDDATFVVGRRC